MKTPDIETVLKQFDSAKAERLLREPRFDQAFRLTMPGRGSFFSSNNDRDIDDVFDETALVAVQEFASRFQAAMTPNHSRWAELEAGSDIPDDDKADVNKELDAVTGAVFDVIHQSNFSQESYEAYLDLSVSLGALEVIEGDALNPVVNNAISLNSLWVGNGPYDMIDKFFRLREYTAVEIGVRYPQHKISADKFKTLMESGKSIKILESTTRDWSEPATERHHRCVIWLEEKMMIHHETYQGIGSCPIVAFRWSKAAGETWGRGPTLNALPAIKTCNLVVQMILENAQMSIAGIYNADDDGVVNPNTIELLPGTIIPRAPGSRGLEPVQAAGNFSVGDLILNDMRGNIKRALYNDMLGNPNKTPMSATEVAERMADLSRQIGAAFGRVWSEFCQRYLERVVFIMKKRGLITLPTVNGKQIRIRAKSPLAQAQAQIDIQNSDRLVELVNARFGPQLANVFIKGEDMSAYWGEKLQVPGRLVRSKPEMAQMMQALQGMAQQAQAMQGGEGEAMPAQPEMPVG